MAFWLLLRLYGILGTVFSALGGDWHAYGYEDHSALWLEDDSRAYEPIPSQSPLYIILENGD